MVKLLSDLKENVLGAGYSEISLRSLVFNKIKNIVKTDISQGIEPSSLNSYIEKIERNPYKITDDDFVNLKKTGFTEDELHEITIVAAFSSGETRIQIGLKLLDNQAS